MGTEKRDDLFIQYQVNPNFILREIVGEAIIVPVGDAGIFENSILSPNATSLFIWKQFEEPNTIDSVIKKAKSLYDDPSGRMEAEICQFVLEYVRTGLLKEVITNE